MEIARKIAALLRIHALYSILLAASSRKQVVQILTWYMFSFPIIFFFLCYVHYIKCLINHILIIYLKDKLFSLFSACYSGTGVKRTHIIKHKTW